MSVPEQAADWCSVSPREGKAGNEVTVTVKVAPNQAYDERNASLKLTSGDFVRYVKVVQKQREALLLSSDKVEMGANGGAFELTVRHSVPFECEIPEQFAAWLTRQESRALSEQTLAFSVEPYGDSGRREGYINFTGGSLTERVHVYQTGGQVLLLSEPEVHVSHEGGPLAVEIRSNCDYSMSAPSASWLKEDQSRALSSHTVYFTVEPYDGVDQERRATVKFSTPDGKLEETLTVVQHEKCALLIGADEVNLGPNSDSFKVGFVANRSVTIEGVPYWLHQTQSRAMEEGEVWFVADMNPTDSRREATLQFRTADEPHAEAAVKVHQDGYSVEIQDAPSGQIMDARTHEYAVQVTGNVPVTAVCSGNFQAKGSEGTTYRFQLNANTKAKERPTSGISFRWGEVTVGQITVVQPEANMSLQREEITVGADGETINIPISSNSEPLYSVMGSSVGLTIDRTASKLTVEENPTTEQRQWTIRARLEGTSNYLDFTIIQQGQKPPADKEVADVVPGDLAKSLATSEALDVTSLDVSGEVNTTDLVMINYLATHGKLRAVDLRDVEIKAGATQYTVGDETFTISEDNTLGDMMFAQSKLERVVLPRGLKKIGRHAFDNSQLQEIEVPQGVTTIEDCAFRGCSRLTAASIPGTVEELSDGVFEQCGNLARVELHEGLKRIGKRTFGNIHATPDGARPAMSTIKIPESVTEIDEYAFQGSGLTEVEVPARMKKLGRKAFYMNYGLKKAVLKGAPDDGELPEETFYYCGEMTELQLPEGITRLGRASLSGAHPTELNMPSTLKVIGEYALNEVWARKVSLHEGLTTIEEGGMSQMPYLQVLDLPSTLREVGVKAFYSTYYSLKEIRCHAAVPPALPANAFSDELKRSIPLYVPSGSKQAYTEAPVWKTFTNIIEL